MAEIQKGTLYVCATPIGNMEDITLRVLNVLKQVDLIAAEDTRHSIKLLNRHGIQNKLTSYHKFNMYAKGPELVELLLQGKEIALITDAGMPGISDPGEELVKLCRENEIPISVCPGATASVCALVVSGLPAGRFVFEGFLPKEKRERKQMVQALRYEQRTVVLYEAPHRLMALLALLLEILGDRRVALVRELTKIHEEVRLCPVSEHIAYYQQNQIRGEFVVILDGAGDDEKQAAFWEGFSVAAHVDYYQAKGFSEKEAMKLTAKDRGIGKREVYQLLKTAHQREESR